MEEEKKTKGRPKLPSDKKKIPLGISIYPKDMELLEYISKKKGLTKSEYITNSIDNIYKEMYESGKEE